MSDFQSTNSPSPVPSCVLDSQQQSPVSERDELSEEELVDICERLWETRDFEELNIRTLIAVSDYLDKNIHLFIGERSFMKARNATILRDSVTMELQKQSEALERHQKERSLGRPKRKSRVDPEVALFDEETDWKESLMERRHELTLSHFDNLWETKMREQYSQPSTRLQKLRKIKIEMEESGDIIGSTEIDEEIKDLQAQEDEECENRYEADYAKARLKLMERFQKEYDDWEGQRERERSMIIARSKSKSIRRSSCKSSSKALSRSSKRKRATTLVDIGTSPGTGSGTPRRSCRLFDREDKSDKRRSVSDSEKRSEADYTESSSKAEEKVLWNLPDPFDVPIKRDRLLRSLKPADVPFAAQKPRKKSSTIQLHQISYKRKKRLRDNY
jgi:hypothetical protein